MKKIETIVKKIFGLKPMSKVAHKVMAAARDPESSVSDLSNIIAYDAAATANLLKMANSAYFGRKEKVDSVKQACVCLGTDQIVDLVLMTGSAESLNPAQKGYDLTEGDLWKNAVSSALIARELAEKKNSGEIHLIFTAALLKDIGKTILHQYVGDSFTEIDALVTEKGKTFREAEKKVIGIDHAELGALVARTWQFSPKMEDIIRNHHQPQDASICSFEASIVYMADMLCMMMGIGVGCDGLAYRFHKDVIERLQLTQQDFQEIIAGFGEKLQEVEALVSMP